MPQRSRLAPFPIIEDLSESRLAGGWLKMQLALLHASDEERSQKSMTFQEYKRQIASKPSEGNMKADHFVAQDFEVGYQQRKLSLFGDIHAADVKPRLCQCSVNIPQEKDRKFHVNELRGVGAAH